jgi:hypothetical protein
MFAICTMIKQRSVGGLMFERGRCMRLNRSMLGYMGSFLILRSSFVLVLALSVAGLGAASELSCTVTCSRANDCPCCRGHVGPGTSRMDESGPQLVATCSGPCCLLRAPFPAPQYQESGSTLSLNSGCAADSPAATSPSIRSARPVPIVQDTSPPSLQPLLCTFLI